MRSSSAAGKRSCISSSEAEIASELFERSAPLSSAAHLIDGGSRRHLLVPDGTRLYEVDDPTYAELERLLHSRDESGLATMLERLGVQAPAYVDDAPPAAPPIRALSLAVAQACNLGCTYCYAQGGEFGGPAAHMSAGTAGAAVDLLFADAVAGERVNLAFLGGEPLLNRAVIHAATERALRIAADRDMRVTFSITTNGTQLTPADGEFFEEHAFAVTVSLDGPAAVHDRQRPMRSGRGSFDRVIARVSPLLAMQRRM